MEHKGLVALGIAAMVMLVILIVFYLLLSKVVPNWLFTVSPTKRAGGTQGFAPGGTLQEHPSRGRPPLQRMSL